MFNTAPIFKKIIDSKAKIIILQGGTSSAKSVSALQEVIFYACFNKNKVVTVTGESLPNLRKGAYRDVEWLYSITPYFQSRVKFWNKSDRIIYFDNGSIIEFVSNTDEQSSKAGKRDRLYVDEANGLPWPIFFQLALRTREKVVISYNPSAPFWAHEKLIGTNSEGNDLHADVELIISDHRHNPFLSQSQHDTIENIKDPELFRVYARGLTGNLTGIIFPNWKRITDDQYPKDPESIFWGLDFGYENDETAIVKCVRINNAVFVKEIAYKSGDIPPRRIKEILLAHGYNQEQMIYCDHDPDQVRQLRMLELMAIPARKGQGSLNASIQKVKEYDVFFVGDNIEFERARYMWMVDPDTGKPTNTPKEGGADHLMAATRYAIYTHFYRQE